MEISQLDTLQKLLESALIEKSRKMLIDRAVQIIERKAKKRGIPLTKSQIRRLRKMWLSGDFSSTTLRFSTKPKPISRSLSFTIKDAQDVESHSRSLFNKLNGIIEEVSELQARIVLSALRKKWPRQRSLDRKHIKGFEQRLASSWKIPIELLEMHIRITFDLGTHFIERHRESPKPRRPLLIDVLARLHARSCQVAAEILTLLKSGFADGAMARWRTLHEIVVTALFVEKYGEKMAKRYLAYDAVESYKGAAQYQKYCRALGYEPFSLAEMKAIEIAHSEAITQFGAPFGKNYGWAASAFKKPNHTFVQIEESIGLDHLRPFYKMASQNVHADPKGVLQKLGLTSRDVLLAGPSNVGLADPGHSTAISLLQITACLILRQPTLDHIVMAKVMMILSAEIGTAFLKVHKDIEAKEERLRVKFSKTPHLVS